jgi:hypothetical protein
VYEDDELSTPEHIPELDGVYEGDRYDTESVATAKSMHKEDY